MMLFAHRLLLLGIIGLFTLHNPLILMIDKWFFMFTLHLFQTFVIFGAALQLVGPNVLFKGFYIIKNHCSCQFSLCNRLQVQYGNQISSQCFFVYLTMFTYSTQYTQWPFSQASPNKGIFYLSMGVCFMTGLELLCHEYYYKCLHFILCLPGGDKYM